MPSRMAARSRGPPRPTTSRASARAMSGAMCEQLAGLLAGERVADKNLDGVEALRRSARARSAARPVVARAAASPPTSRCGRSRRAASRAARRRACGSSSRLARVGWSIDKVAPCASRERRRQRRPLAELRALHIGDAGRRGVQLQPRQRAERLGGRDREIIRQPPLGGGAVEHVARHRRHRGQGAQIRRQLGIAIERVGDDDLAGLEPRDLGGQARSGRIRRCGIRRSRCRSRPAQSGSRRPRPRRARGRWRADNCCAGRRAACLRSRCRASPGGRRRAAPRTSSRASSPRPGPRSARRPRRGGRARSGGAGIRRSGSPARRTSGCRGRDACRAWSARCRARGSRSRRPRRTARRNRPSGRTAGNPDWPP